MGEQESRPSADGAGGSPGREAAAADEGAADGAGGTPGERTGKAAEHFPVPAPGVATQEVVSPADGDRWQERVPATEGSLSRGAVAGETPIERGSASCQASQQIAGPPTDALGDHAGTSADRTVEDYPRQDDLQFAATHDGDNRDHRAPVTDAELAELSFAAGAERYLGIADNVQFLRELRKEFHRNPDQDAIIARLKQIFSDRGCVTQEIPNGGLVVRIGKPGPNGYIAMRADIDPLDVDEETGVEFSSQIPKKTQACGHDIHTAAVVGAGLALLDREEATRDVPGAEMDGVMLIFQRDEEKGLGAKAIVEAGVFSEVAEVVALHTNPNLQAGTVAVQDRTANWGCAAFEFEITTKHVQGEKTPTHTARPGTGPDLIDRAHRIKKAIRHTVAAVLRSANPNVKPPNLVASRFIADGPENAMRTRVKLGGTVRSPDFETQALVEKQLSKVIRRVVARRGATYDASSYKYVHKVSPVVNDARVVNRFRAAAHAVGPGFYVDPTDMEGGDDFAEMTNAVPGAYGQLGTWDGDPDVPPEGRIDLHDPRYLPSEEAIYAGVRFLVSYADPAHAGSARDSSLRDNERAL